MGWVLCMEGALVVSSFRYLLTVIYGRGKHSCKWYSGIHNSVHNAYWVIIMSKRGKSGDIDTTT